MDRQMISVDFGTERGRELAEAHFKKPISDMVEAYLDMWKANDEADGFEPDAQELTDRLDAVLISFEGAVFSSILMIRDAFSASQWDLAKISSERLSQALVLQATTELHGSASIQ